MAEGAWKNYRLTFPSPTSHSHHFLFRVLSPEGVFLESLPPVEDPI